VGNPCAKKLDQTERGWKRKKVETTRKGIEQHKTTQHKTNLGPYLPFFKISAIAIETA
jgi:hypothetical protein